MNEKNQKLNPTIVSEDFLENFASELNSIINVPILDEEQEKKIILMLLKTLLKEGGCILIGDVAFQTRSDLEKCHKENKDGCFILIIICQTILKIDKIMFYKDELC